MKRQEVLRQPGGDFVDSLGHLLQPLHIDELNFIAILNQGIALSPVNGTLDRDYQSVLMCRHGQFCFDDKLKHWLAFICSRRNMGLDTRRDFTVQVYRGNINYVLKQIFTLMEITFTFHFSGIQQLNCFPVTHILRLTGYDISQSIQQGE